MASQEEIDAKNTDISLKTHLGRAAIIGTLVKAGYSIETATVIANAVMVGIGITMLTSVIHLVA